MEWALHEHSIVQSTITTDGVSPTWAQHRSVYHHHWWSEPYMSTASFSLSSPLMEPALHEHSIVQSIITTDEACPTWAQHRSVYHHHWWSEPYMSTASFSLSSPLMEWALHEHSIVQSIITTDGACPTWAQHRSVYHHHWWSLPYMSTASFSLSSPLMKPALHEHSIVQSIITTDGVSPTWAQHRSVYHHHWWSEPYMSTASFSLSSPLMEPALHEHSIVQSIITTDGACPTWAQHRSVYHHHWWSLPYMSTASFSLSSPLMKPALHEHSIVQSIITTDEACPTWAQHRSVYHHRWWSEPYMSTASFSLSSPLMEPALHEHSIVQSIVTTDGVSPTWAQHRSVYHHHWWSLPYMSTASVSLPSPHDTGHCYGLY